MIRASCTLDEMADWALAHPGVNSPVAPNEAVRKQFHVGPDRAHEACVAARLRAKGASAEGKPTAAPSEGTEYKEDGGAATLNVVSHTVRTVEQALAKGAVDMDVWEVERFVVNSWEMGSKDNDGNPLVTPLWQVKLWLRRKRLTARALYEVAAKVLDGHQPKYGPLLKQIHSRGRPCHTGKLLVEIDAMDLHIGLYAWARETGEDYDHRIAVQRLYTVVEDLIAKVKPMRPARILLPVGNDLLHVDNAAAGTHKGTPQDMDTRFPLIFEESCEAVINVVDRLMAIAPVQVLVVPGNHDQDVCFHLGEVLKRNYRKVDMVDVDNEPLLRKYVRWGACLLGFTHGGQDWPALRELPLLMAQEVPALWAATTWREWHMGHWHRKRETIHTAGDTWQGVHVRVIPALSGTDAWHYQHGFTGGWKAAEAYLWDEQEAYVGHLAALVAKR